MSLPLFLQRWFDTRLPASWKPPTHKMVVVLNTEAGIGWDSAQLLLQLMAVELEERALIASPRVWELVAQVLGMLGLNDRKTAHHSHNQNPSSHFVSGWSPCGGGRSAGSLRFGTRGTSP